MKLHLGCGRDYKEGWTNLDKLKSVKADVYHDLDVYPYPFKDDTFNEVFISHTLEHLDNPIQAMEELHRIMKPDAKLVILIPHFTRALTDMTHKSGYALGSFDVFNPDSKYCYSKKHFKIIRREIHMRGRNSKPFWKFLDKLANANQHLFEAIWCYWFAGAEEIEFEMQVIKRKCNICGDEIINNNCSICD